MRVVAVVVTYNRKVLLGRCLEALEQSSRPPDRVLVVDNASTDGTDEVVASHPAVRYVRLARNGGGAEGFHHGVRIALAEEEPDWLWLMDDDCIAAPDALSALLASPRALDPSVGVLAPVARDGDGRLLPINRGYVRPRWFFAPLVAAPEEEQAPGVETEIEFCSFVGPLVRASAVREAGLPMREMFIRFEDVEYMGRLRERGWRIWLVGSSLMTHLDPNPVPGADIRAMWGDYSQRIPFDAQWKRLYGFRNLLYTARRGGYMHAGQAVAQFLVQAVRTLLFHERRGRTLLLLAAYGLDGWRGRFRNVPPERWRALAHEGRPLRYVEREALSYDRSARATPPA